MHCSDLERYLEAHLDGRLGRNRSAIFQRHLSSCDRCRQRVDDLRQFEKELHGKFRTMRAADALWDSLETTLVSATSNKPVSKQSNPSRQSAFFHPVTPAGLAEEGASFRPVQAEEVDTDKAIQSEKTGLGSTGRWLGAATGALLLGAVGLWAYNSSYGLSSMASFEPGTGIDMRTSDGFILRNWLGNEMGYPLPQTPQATGFVLLGGEIVERDVGSSAVIYYDSDLGPATLHMRRSEPQLSFEDLAQNYLARGMQAVAWSQDQFDYVVFAGPDIKGVSNFQN